MALTSPGVPLGVSFSPANQQLNAAGTAPLVGFEGLPGAIQLLSLRLPKVAGAEALAPDALLQSPGGAARPALVSAVVQSVLKSLGAGALPATALPGASASDLASARGLVPGGTAAANTGAPGREAGALGTTISQASTLPTPTPSVSFERPPGAGAANVPPSAGLLPTPPATASPLAGARPASGLSFGFGNHAALA